MMGSALVILALRVAYVFRATVRIAALVDSCEVAWVSVLESDSAATLHLIQELVVTLEEEADTQRASVREREGEHTPSTVLGVISQCVAHLRFDSNTSMSYESKAPRHLLMSSDDISGYQSTARDMYHTRPRDKYHTSAACTLPGFRVPAVECLDQLYFQVPPSLSRNSNDTHPIFPNTNARDTDSVTGCTLTVTCVKAVVVAPMFQRKVLGWAHLSGALMQGAGDARCGNGNAGDVDWSKLIKSSDDAVSKVSEQYNGAPQYLVDLVRNRLIFDSVDAQYRCLTSICQDPSVVVVRVANTQHCDKRQAPNRVTGTFQKPAVTVYFVLTTPEAVDMGVSGHVMELELVLHQIWVLFQSDHAHYSYVAYRRALLSEQNASTRWLRRLVVNAAQSRRGRASVVALQNDCPADQMKESFPDGVAKGALVAFVKLPVVSRVRQPVVSRITLCHCDFQAYFQVDLDKGGECFRIGTCEDNQGIPPVLLARLGYDGLWDFNPGSISGSAKDNWRLQEIFDTLCLRPESARDQTLLVEKEFESPDNSRDVEVHRSLQTREVEEEVEEVCGVSPEMRDLLRTKCLERGDAKAYSLFEVCWCERRVWYVRVALCTRCV